MKRRKILIPIILILLIGGGTWYYFRTGGCRHDCNLTLYGNVDIREVLLAFHATGRIQRLLVEEGDTVKVGELVAELDPVRYDASAAQFRAKVNSQRQVLDRLLAGSRPEEIAEKRALLAAAEAKLQDAEKTNRRMQTLVSKNLIAQQDADNTEAAFKSARGNRDAARESLNLAIIGPRKEDIAAARAQLQADEAALALAEIELADTKLYSPTEAVVRNRILEVGDMVSPQTPVYTLALTQPVWVRAYISEPDLGKIAPGMKAEVRTDSFPDKIYRGWVGFISPTAEFTPKEVQTLDLRSRLVYQVRIFLRDPGNEVRLGMPATVTIPLTERRNSSAVIPDKEK